MIAQKMVTAGARFAALFDGTNDYLSKATDLSGISDGKQGAVSVWLYRVGTSATGNLFSIISQHDGSASQGVSLDINMSSSARPRVTTFDTSGTVNSQWTTTDVTALEGWTHLMASWDLADANKIESYVDGADQSEAYATRTDSNINHTAGQFGICGRPTGNTGISRWHGRIAELWFTPTYVDLTVEATRLKFRTAAGKPASLGATGAVPTGSQPLLYMRDFADFKLGRNRGSGGNFTVNGTLVAAKGPW